MHEPQARRARARRSWLPWRSSSCWCSRRRRIAAPTEPTLTVDELRAKLESGPLDGYLKTVVKGYTIEKIPVKSRTSSSCSWGDLILAEASGPVIDKLGGVASGMSGSPVYVDDGGVDKLIGALSYGSDFTIGGTFMATPIAVHVGDRGRLRQAAGGGHVQAGGARADRRRPHRAASSSPAASRRRRRSTPGRASSSWPRSGSSRSAACRRRRAPTRSSPRGSRSRPDSRWWPRAAAPWRRLEAPPLEAGSSIFQLFSQGAVWYGSAGTATYVNGDVVVAYGHPAWWTGPCGAAMAGGYVSGIWPSQWAPFKLIAPRDIKGTIVQDRNWGIAGIVGQDPDMIPVTSRVTFPESGRDVTTASTAAEWAFKTSGYEDLAGYLIMQALWDACDVSFMPGSAETTTTVHVSDETGPYVGHDRQTRLGFLRHHLRADLRRHGRALEPLGRPRRRARRAPRLGRLRGDGVLDEALGPARRHRPARRPEDRRQRRRAHLLRLRLA